MKTACFLCPRQNKKAFMFSLRKERNGKSPLNQFKPNRVGFLSVNSVVKK